MTEADNFVFGDFFADVKCRFGHKVRMFNIGRGHFIACDKCRSYIFVGSNLMSCWREENKDIWRKNSDSVMGYKFIEWDHPGGVSVRWRQMSLSIIHEGPLLFGAKRACRFRRLVRRQQKWVKRKWV